MMSSQDATRSTFRRWSDVVGNSSTVRSLRRVIGIGRVHHANLFVGPAGIGKRQAAYAFASELHCEVPEDSGACGRCSQCLLHKRGEHPDFIEVAPDGRYIKIDAIREMQRQTRFRPYTATRRLIVIDNAELMREEAANALLKTLEEPSGETVLVVIAAEPNRLLPTIRSRCQPVRFAPLATEDTRDVLLNMGVEADDALVQLSYGSPGRALTLLESGVLDELAEWASVLESLIRGGSSVALKGADRLAGSREESDVRFEALVWLARDVLFIAAGQDERVANGTLASSLRACAEALGVERASRLCTAIEHARVRFLGNSNPRMVFEDLLLDAQDMMQVGHQHG